MNIAIIGAGNVGRALAAGFSKERRHAVTFGVRDPDAKRAALRASHPAAEVATLAEAAGRADVVVLCTPWAQTREAIAACGSLAGKTVLDATNPLKPDYSGLDLGPAGESGAERIAAWAAGAQVFKTFNQVGAEQMNHPRLPGGRPVMCVAGDGARKPEVLALVSSLGLDAVDAGPLVNARLLENLAMLWITLAIKQGLGRGVAFSLLRG